ncbi:hypothetical protein ACHAQK_007912 [Fusarium lateritium]
MQILWLIGLLVKLALAADLDIWEVHHSCNEHLQMLQKAYDDAAELAKAAVASLDVVQQALPADHASSAGSEWIRISRAVSTTFGFLPDPAGNDATVPMSRVRYVFDRMNTAMQGTENIPKRGYSGKFEKPMFACGDDGWQWVSRDDVDPNDPQGRLLKESKAASIGNAVGAFVFERRYSFRSTTGGIVDICEPGVLAETITGFDMIVWCTSNWDQEMIDGPSPIDEQSSIEEDDDIEAYEGLSLTVIHELAHWYGHGEGWEVTDTWAVTEDGLPLYQGYDNKPTVNYDGSTKVNVACYHFYYVVNLADNDDGGTLTGPLVATRTAEAYAFFALMAFLKDYDWAPDGLAKLPSYA